MTEAIPTRAVLVTDWGEYDVPPSVAAKIEAYPKIRFFNPFTEEWSEYEQVDMNHPVLARYFRLITNHMACAQ